MKRDICGTEPGYRKHRRNKETKCQECRDAHNVHRRATYTKEANRRYIENYRNRKKLERAELRAARKQAKLDKALKIKRDKEAEYEEYLAIKAKVLEFNKLVVEIDTPPVNLRKATPRQRHEIRQILLKRDGMNCYLCDVPVNFRAPYIQGQEGWEWFPHLEHVIPVSKGGTDELDNIKLAHAKCNRDKGVKIL
jgi:hypothetical protein